MEKIIALSTFAVMVNAHGGLTFPPPRNNYRNQDPTVRVNPNTFHGNGESFHPSKSIIVSSQVESNS